jgi:hypothetical protein
LLVVFQLLLQGFDQRGDGLLALFEIALRAFLKFGKGLVGQPEEFRRSLFQGVGAQGLERLAEVSDGLVLNGTGVGQRAFVQGALLGQQLIGGLAAGQFGGGGGLRLSEFVAELLEFTVAVGQLLAQFGQERFTAGSGRLAEQGQQPAQRGADDQTDGEISEWRHKRPSRGRASALLQ